MTHDCALDTQRCGDTRVVHVAGRFDWAAASGFRDLTRDHCPEPGVVIDLTHATRLDSGGVGVLLAAIARAHRRGQQLAIVATDPHLLEVLVSLGVPSIVPVVGTEGEAVRRIAAPVPA